MSREDLLFRAALSRFVLGVTALVLVPILYPSAVRHAWVYGAYIAFAAAEQVLIRKRIGGMMRSFVAGLVDVAVLTFTVHRLGSVATVMASLYFFAGVLNALVVGLRVGIALASLNALAYTAVIGCEQRGWLPFAPDDPDIARLGTPGASQAIASAVLVTVLLVTSTAIVGMLVGALRGREAALVHANERLVILSERDPLTNLYNRRYLFERLRTELERVRRGHPLALLMLDLDRFKKVNDTQGHLRGDLLLQEIAGALSRATRAIDVAGRYGGDEFVVILPDTDSDRATVVADRVAACVPRSRRPLRRVRAGHRERGHRARRRGRRRRFALASCRRERVPRQGARRRPSRRMRCPWTAKKCPRPGPGREFLEESAWHGT